MMRRILSQGLVGSLMLIWAAGCGRATGNLSGEVKFQGKAIPWGRITFLPPSGPPVVGEIDAGRYAVAGVPVGHARVAIESFQMFPRPTQAAPKKGTPPPVNAPVAGREPPAYTLVIPAHYSSPDSSRLEQDVQKGDQVRDFDLTP